MKSNEFSDGSLLNVLLALKENILTNLNAVDLGQVISIDENNNSYKCTLLNDPDKIIECIAIKDISINNNDVVLINFTKSDFRGNLTRIKNKSPAVKLNESNYYNLSYGIITNIVYRGE